MSKNKKRNKIKMSEETKKTEETAACEPAEETEKAEAVEPEAETKEPEAAEPEKAGAAPEFEPMTLTAEEVKALKEKLDKLEAEKEDAIKQAQRLQAEFENYRKRNAQLASESRDDGVRDAVKQLLPVVDNFERALVNAPEDGFAQGIRNISKQLMTALEKCGAEELPAEGQFDPHLHEAVMKDSVEGKESGEITAVLQKGWRVKGKIVRYAMVKVNE